MYVDCLSMVISLQMKPSGQDFKKVATTLVDILFIGLMLHLSQVKKWTVNQCISHMNWYCVYNHIKLYSPFQRSAHILQKSRDWCQQIKFLCSENMVFSLIQNNYEIPHRPIFFVHPPQLNYVFFLHNIFKVFVDN